MKKMSNYERILAQRNHYLKLRKRYKNFENFIEYEVTSDGEIVKTKPQ